MTIYLDSTEFQKSSRNPATPMLLRRSGSLNLDANNFKGIDSLRTGIGMPRLTDRLHFIFKCATLKMKPSMLD